MTRIAIIAAMAGELRPLVPGWRRESRNGVDLWLAHRGASVWIAACAGSGSEAAARAFSEAERGGAVDAVVSVGWAGALGGEFATGHAYVVSGVVDASTGERFAAAGSSGACLLASSRRVADRDEKLRLRPVFGADLVDMEAAGVARLAGLRGIPFYGIKGVSDGVGDQLPDFNRFISADGKFGWVRFLFFAMVRPGCWPRLARMGGNSRRAAQAIRARLLDVIGRFPQ